MNMTCKCLRNQELCNDGFLTLEILDKRVLLSSEGVPGVDTDWDDYRIILDGPGTILNADLSNMILTGTTIQSDLTIEVTSTNGDGLVNVGLITTGGADLGRVNIEGNLGGLTCGRIRSLEVESLGKVSTDTNSIAISGDIQDMEVEGRLENFTVVISGSLDSMSVGSRRDTASGISNSSITVAGDLDDFSCKQSLTAGTIIAVGGSVKAIDIDKSIMNSMLNIEGSVGSLNIDGYVQSSSLLEVGGNIEDFRIDRNFCGSTLEVGGELDDARFDNDVMDSTIRVNRGGKMIFRENVDNTKFGITADLELFQASDCQDITLRVGGSIETIKIKRDLDSALISVLNGIGQISVGQDVNRSQIMGGVDIGDDLIYRTADDDEWGDVIIEKVTIKGDMVDSSLIAGIWDNGNYYGNGDDAATSNHIGTARIYDVRVKGEIYSTLMPGETYAIGADDGIDRVRDTNGTFGGVAGVALLEY